MRLLALAPAQLTRISTRSAKAFAQAATEASVGHVERMGANARLGLIEGPARSCDDLGRTRFKECAHQLASDAPARPGDQDDLPGDITTRNAHLDALLASALGLGGESAA